MAKKARVYNIPEWAKMPEKSPPAQEPEPSEIQHQSEPKQLTPRELLEAKIAEYEYMHEQYQCAASLLDRLKEEKSRVWEFIERSHLSKYIDTRSRNRFRLREDLQSFRNSFDDELRDLAQQASDLIAGADVDARENEALAQYREADDYLLSNRRYEHLPEWFSDEAVASYVENSHRSVSSAILTHVYSLVQDNEPWQERIRDRERDEAQKTWRVPFWNAHHADLTEIATTLEEFQSWCNRKRKPVPPEYARQEGWFGDSWDGNSDFGSFDW